MTTTGRVLHERSVPQPRGEPEAGLNQGHRRRVGVIHQPYFLPWLGYFSKLAFCDVFVLLDNVEFTKGHYLDRARVINMHGEIVWLSLPTGQNLAVAINQVRLRPPDSYYLTKLIRTLAVSYATAQRFEDEWPFLEGLLSSAFSSSNGSLIDISLELIIGLLDRLQLARPVLVRASAITTASDPTERLLDICRAIELTDIVVGSGRSRSVHDFPRLVANGVHLQVQDYLAVHPQYSQARRRQRPFQPGLSVIDALLNVGFEETRRFVSDNRYTPTPLGTVGMALPQEDAGI